MSRSLVTGNPADGGLSVFTDERHVSNAYLLTNNMLVILIGQMKLAAACWSSTESVQAIRKRKTGGSAVPRHSQTRTKARSQRAKPASPVTFTARMTVIGSNAPHNAPPSARTQIHASAYPDRTVLLMYGAQFSAAIDFPTGRISTTLRDQYLPSRFQ